METLAQRGDYKVVYNGSNTYMDLNDLGDSQGYFETKRRAMNAMNKIAEMAGQ